jgi:hypothetical protein
MQVLPHLFVLGGVEIERLHRVVVVGHELGIKPQGWSLCEISVGSIHGQ